MSSRICQVILCVAVAVSGAPRWARGQARDTTSGTPMPGTAATIIEPANRQTDTGMVRRNRIDTSASRTPVPAAISPMRRDDMQQMSMPGMSRPGPDSGQQAMHGMSSSEMSQTDMAKLVSNIQGLMALQMRMLADPVIHERVIRDSVLRRQLNEVIATMSSEDTTRMPEVLPPAAAGMANMPGMKTTAPSRRSESYASTKTRSTSSTTPRRTPTKKPPKAKTGSMPAADHGKMTMPGMNMPASKKP